MRTKVELPKVSIRSNNVGYKRVRRHGQGRLFMMSNLEQTIKQLASTFTAQDIMVPKERIVCAHDEATARKLLEKNPNFDIIPIERNGTLSAYIERGFDQIKPIRLQDIISDATNILDIVDVFQERRFCFVLVKNCLEGYIHFSDLNNRIVKLPYFLILEALEKHLVNEVILFITEDNLESVLDPKRVITVKKRMGHMKKKRSDLHWVNILSFNEIVRFACRFDKVKLEQNQVDTISKVRNLVCHAEDPLVNEHKDVRRLSETKRICISVLKGMMT